MVFAMETFTIYFRRQTSNNSQEDIKITKIVMNSMMKNYKSDLEHENKDLIWLWGPRRISLNKRLKYRFAIYRVKQL